MADIDVSKIKWREVTRDEYNEAAFNVPHRETYTGFSPSSPYVYELGTIPRELPTKRGAIITPPKNWKPGENWEDTFFVYNGEYWSWIEPDDSDSFANGLAQEALDDGGIIQFEGIDE